MQLVVLVILMLVEVLSLLLEIITSERTDEARTLEVVLGCLSSLAKI